MKDTKTNKLAFGDEFKELIMGAVGEAVEFILNMEQLFDWTGNFTNDEIEAMKAEAIRLVKLVPEAM